MRKLVAILVVLLLLTACASPAATPTSAPASEEKVPTATPAPEAPAEAASGHISLAGSTTVQPLAEKLAEAFKAANPDVEIDVAGGGSSVGVKSAGEGAADIGMASREVKQSELDTYTNLNVVAIAYDGIAVGVHPDVAVDDLTIEQVRDIFAGAITNWSEVGGADEMIVVVAREEGSGTRGAFEELVMGKEGPQITDTAILLPSNGAVRTTVSTTPNAVGFLSFGYLDGTVKALSVNGVAATEANAGNGSYPVVRPLNMMTDGTPEGAAAAFLDFILGGEGQAVVAEEGYITLQ